MAKREMSISLEMIAGSLSRGFAVSVCAGLVLALLGPFGTFERLDFPHRLGFWLSAICFGYLFNMPIYWAVRLFGEPHRVPIWIIILSSACLAAFPTTLLVNGIAATLLNLSTTDSFFELYPLVLAIGIPLQTLGHFASAMSFQKTQGQDIASITPETKTTPDGGETAKTAEVAKDDRSKLVSTGSSDAARFFQRLPPKLGTDIQCLQMEDHYLRVYTPLGSDLILMRMSDAAIELQSLDGLLVHRSFWVARSAVSGWTRNGKSLVLHLSFGKNVPVARDRQAQLKAGGWLIPSLQRK